jgi:PTH1 family peptidyl-tRNA hydrolase
VHQAVVYRKRDLLLVKPSTYMNASGDTVRSLVEGRRLRPEDVLVIHDDLDLPLGRLRIVPGGGAGSHKGVQSVIDALGTTSFPRLKIGIEIDQRGIKGSEFVLQPFPEPEWIRLAPVLHRAVEAVAAFARLPLDHVMTQFNAGPEKGRTASE